MAIRVVQLGTSRQRGEGLRLGTVRRPPRGVPKARHASEDWYDVWLPNLSPSDALVKRALATTDLAARRRLLRTRFRAEMKRPDPSHVLDVLAALSHTSSFSIGCYCEHEEDCHRFVLRELLAERGALMD